MRSRANQSYHEEEYDVDDGMTCTLDATAYYHYTPGTMYKRNGDPGDPPETEFEVLSIELTDFKRLNDETGEMEDYEPTPEEMKAYEDEAQEMFDNDEQACDWEDIIPERED